MFDGLFHCLNWAETDTAASGRRFASLLLHVNSTIKYCTISPTILEETFQLQPHRGAAPGPRWGQAPRPPRVPPPFQIPVYATDYAYDASKKGTEWVWKLASGHYVP